MMEASKRALAPSNEKRTVENASVKRVKLENVGVDCEKTSKSLSGSSGAQGIFKSVIERIAASKGCDIESDGMPQLEANGAGGTDSENFALDDDEEKCRHIPSGFPLEFVAERDKVVSLFFDAAEGSQEEFLPTFVHQVFPRDKYIIGYRGLHVDVKYTCRWRLYVHVHFDEQIKDENKWGDLVDEHPLHIVKNSPLITVDFKDENYTEDAAEFAAWCEQDRLKSMSLGGIISSLPNGATKVPVNFPKHEPKISLFKIDDISQSPEAQSLLHRAQALSLWWIESAEQTDAKDWRWSLLLTFCGDTLIGFLTVFTFVNPLRDSPFSKRIAQVLVLPQFRRKGICRALVKAVYESFISDPSIFEITVEDPCDDFIRLRDGIECGLVSGCDDILMEDAQNQKLVKFTNGIVSADAQDRIHHQIKITHRQTQRCFEILRLREILKDGCEGELSKFRLDVKRRLYNDNVEGVQDRPKEDLKTNLQMLFEALDEEYRAVIRTLIR